MAEGRLTARPYGDMLDMLDTRDDAWRERHRVNEAPVGVSKRRAHAHWMGGAGVWGG